MKPEKPENHLYRPLQLRKHALSSREIWLCQELKCWSDPAQAVKHNHELDKASGIIRQVLEKSENLTNFEVQNLREKLIKTVSDGEFKEVLKSNEDMYAYISDVMKSKLLSEIINLPLDSNCPLIGWPTNLKENINCETVQQLQGDVERGEEQVGDGGDQQVVLQHKQGSAVPSRVQGK